MRAEGRTEGRLLSSQSAAAIRVSDSSRVPLATQIARQFMWQVASGRIVAGSLLPPISELADDLGVSVHTVRAAYRQLADDGIVSISRGSRTSVLGYDRTRALIRNDSHPSYSIGVMVPAFTDYYADFLQALSLEAGLEGWLPIICQTQHYDARVTSRHLDQLFSRNVDGVILIHFTAAGDEAVVDVVESSSALRPFVFVDSANVGMGWHILADRATDGFEVTMHLIEHGHRRIAHIASPTDSSSNLLSTGYARALAAADLPAGPELVANVVDFSLEAGAKAATHLLLQDDPPTAIFCAGDILALGAISASHERGLRVPRDVAVMGYGEIPFARLAAPPLSTVRLPADRLGHEAIRTLRQAIHDGAPQAPVTVATEPVFRESCNCATRPDGRSDAISTRRSSNKGGNQ